MKKDKCRHECCEQSSEIHAFFYSVAVPPYTEECPRAHGGISYTERCSTCGAERSVNENQGSCEYGPWGPDQATLSRRERAEKDRIRREREAADAAAMASAGIKVLRYEPGGNHWDGCRWTERDGQILVFVRGQEQWIAEWWVRKAASQSDDGDGLVPVYRAILSAAHLCYLQQA